ncbi:B- and T-lymphocyte attenuator-like isoform X2 [Xiphias gladius]|uniref:B- and T-lymphocyte attenuator-like isoform X2 n=1 Tax=Xiphias gladius TaxID=8245 RepID=UPI001A9A2050|nr:B- and T-lymphocyte attenuator-like isoform X2 [Xiphias gladius]
MRPNHCWNVLHVPMLAALVLTLNADSKDSDCFVEIRVRRKTVYEALAGADLRINCTVAFCNNSSPAVSWYKVEEISVPVNVNGLSHVKTEWKELSRSEGISYLIFQEIRSSDSGLYQCWSGNGVSHSINVSVHDATTSNPETPQNLWIYVYSAAGIVAFVIMVIVTSVMSVRGCKRKSKRETDTENQYMAIPMFEQPFPHASLQPSPRESPSAPPPRRSTRRKAPAPRPNESTLPRDSEHVYDRTKKDRDRQRNGMEEEGSSVVYAALNHQMPPGAAVRPPRPREEFSEYAAICVS